MMTHPKKPHSIALLSYGFRPFFLLATIWAGLAMIFWVGLLAGVLELPTRFSAVSWHAHEFLFGYTGAVIAGFLLTAVPNWTGRLPVKGGRLAVLATLWVIGRVAIASSALWPVAVVAGADLAFLAALWLLVLREIVTGKNWSNLPVLGMLGVLILANLLFHVDAAKGNIAAQSFGLRLGVSTTLMLISMIGGKIIPSFTRNWLAKQGQTNLPTPPMQRFDKITLAATAVTLLGWSLAPAHQMTGIALLAISVLHMARLLRWKGALVLSEPLLWVLHIAYFFVPIGAALTGVAILAPDALPATFALHIWTAGAIGLMTLGVMTRASLGHCGRPLKANFATRAIYVALIAALITRLAADLLPEFRSEVLNLSALLWIVAFWSFVLSYGPMLARHRTRE